MSTATQSIREIVTRHHPQPAFFIDLILIFACRRTFARSSVPGAATLYRSSSRKARRRGGRKNLVLWHWILRCFAGRLIQHIVRVHHHCVRQELPALAEMASKVAAKRSDRAPELAEGRRIG